MEQKKKSDENLIAFGPLDEFDPVAHQFEASKAAADAENFDPNSKARNEGDLLGLGASGPPKPQTFEGDASFLITEPTRNIKKQARRQFECI